MSDVRLAAIHVYPVKSCRAVPLDTVTVAPTGLEGDRLYQVVDDAGTPLTQRQHPGLATVQPTLLEGGIRLDFTETDDQALGAINAGFSQALTGAIYAVRCFVDRTIPMNEPTPFSLRRGELANR